jgi:hypothetical protein
LGSTSVICSIAAQLLALVEPNLKHVPEISGVVVGHFADARHGRLNNLFNNAPTELARLALGEQFRSGSDFGSGKQGTDGGLLHCSILRAGRFVEANA